MVRRCSDLHPLPCGQGCTRSTEDVAYHAIGAASWSSTSAVLRKDTFDTRRITGRGETASISGGVGGEIPMRSDSRRPPDERHPQRLVAKVVLSGLAVLAAPVRPLVHATSDLPPVPTPLSRDAAFTRRAPSPTVAPADETLVRTSDRARPVCCPTTSFSSQIPTSPACRTAAFTSATGDSSAPSTRQPAWR